SLYNKSRLGCINFHPAILPDWRGLGGCNIAILEKREVWGATAHYVNENIDTGKILGVFDFPFDYLTETAFTLKNKTETVMCELYRDIISEILLNGKVSRRLIVNEGGNYLSKNQMLNLMRIDPLIDDVDLKVRAFWFPPHSGAYLEINGIKYTLVNDKILSQIAHIKD
ncbi:MAG: hypothetical protein LBN97_07690, partial [Oscillospiraceae bacterium]|nr:hypothetical protein [Oscillospiraceae bacterium]